MIKFYLTKSSNFWEASTETITFNSLEELMQFINNNGKVVIFPKEENDLYPTLEIYDTWRE